MLTPTAFSSNVILLSLLTAVRPHISTIISDFPYFQSVRPIIQINMLFLFPSGVLYRTCFYTYYTQDFPI
uniref:Putative secreted protein n=1 Tax=Xenopsylla cheopis TaxID=163159 RepID=A0A6M2DWL1_XENCH